MLKEIIAHSITVIQENPREIALAVVSFYLLYYFVLYPFILSPFKDIPGPYWYRVSRYPSLYKQQQCMWIDVVHQMHIKYGNVVLVAPDEISVDGDAKYVKDIYIKNFPKSKFYENFTNHGGKDNIFASLENDKHIAYKKILMGLYSKSAIFSRKNHARSSLVNKVGHLVHAVYKSSVTGESPDYINAKSEVNEHGKGHTLKTSKWFNPCGKKTSLGIDVYSLYGSLAMDVVSEFELGKGNGTNLLLHPEERDIVVMHRQIASMSFWTTLMPRFWDWAATPAIKNSARVAEIWRMALYANAEEKSVDFSKDRNFTPLEALKASGLKGPYAYSFLTDNIFAGHETTAIQLTYLTYELSRLPNRPKQDMLRRELIQNFGIPSGVNDTIDDLEKVDCLPYLNALIEENSRVHTSIPGAEPRIVDRPYNIVLNSGKAVNVPIGTTISCQPYSIHRSKEIFPDPESFIPDRWLKYENESDDDFKKRIAKQQKYMMPFGKGVRMCLGMNLALIEMKLAIANLFWHFNCRLCKDWCEVTEYDPVEKTPKEIKMGEIYNKNNNTDEEMMTMVDTYTTRPFNDECWIEWDVNRY